MSLPERVVQVLGALTERGPLPVSELRRHMPGMKTDEGVREIVKAAADRGLLSATTAKDDLPVQLTRMFRGPVQYIEIGRPGGFVLACTIGRTYFAIGLADANGRLLSTDGERPDRSLQGSKQEKSRAAYHAGQIEIHPRLPDISGVDLIDEIAERSKARLHRLAVRPAEVRAATVSVPAPASVTQRRLLSNSIEPRLAELSDLDNAFCSALGAGDFCRLERVIVANDADVAARGEVRYGRAYGMQDSLVLYAAYGIGAGVVARGSVLRITAGGGVGEVGHTSPCVRRDGGAEQGLVALDPADELYRCVCGATGHLEAMAGGEAVIRRLRASIGSFSDPPPPLLAALLEDESRPDAEVLDVLLQEAFQPRPWLPAREALLDAAHLLGVALHGLIHIFNPEAVFLTGKLSEAGEPFLEEVKSGVAAVGSLQGYRPPIEFGAADGEFERRLTMVKGAAMSAVRSTPPLISREELELMESDKLYP